MVDQVKNSQQISVMDIKYPKCLKHSNLYCESFSLDVTRPIGIQCIKCAVQNQSSPQSHVFFQDVIDCDTSKIVQNWPPLLNHEEITNQVYEISKYENSSASNKYKISQFFDELQKEIIEIIQKNKKDILIKSDLQNDTWQNFLQIYHKMAEIDKLKEIISSSGQCNSTLNSNLQELTQQKIDEKEKNTELIRDSILQFENQSYLINFEYPQKTKEDILNQISKINFFFSQDLDQEQSSVLQQNILGQNEIRQNAIQDRAQQIMKLISNKSNYCNDTFLNDIEACLNKINPILNSLIKSNSIHIDDRRSIDFDQYSLEQLDDLNALVKITSQISSDYKSINNSNDNNENEQINNIDNKQINNNNNKLISLQVQQLSTFILENFIQKNQQVKQIISEMLRKYPIFETLNFSIFKNLEFNISKSNYGDSQSYSTVSKNQQGQIYIERNYSNQNIQGYIDTPIFNKLKYVIRLELDCQSQLNYYFWAGLLNMTTLNTSWEQYKKNIFSNNAQNNQKVLKGKGLWDLSVRKVVQQVEIRFCVEQNIFICLDYPHYDNITTINQDILFNNNEQYYFGMMLFNQNNKIIITNIQVVDEFPEKNW